MDLLLVDANETLFFFPFPFCIKKNQEALNLNVFNNISSKKIVNNKTLSQYILYEKKKKLCQKKETIAYIYINANT
jgi:hypothetical protein